MSVAGWSHARWKLDDGDYVSAWAHEGDGEKTMTAAQSRCGKPESAHVKGESDENGNAAEHRQNDAGEHGQGDDQGSDELNDDHGDEGADAADNAQDDDHRADAAGDHGHGSDD